MYDHKLLEITIAFILLIMAFAFFLVLFAVQHKHYQSYHRFERELLLSQLEKKELSLGFQERELMLDEVAQEIHDNIGQLLYVIRMNLHNIDECSTSEDQKKMIRYVSEVTDMAIRDTQYMSRCLSRDFIRSLGLYHMLEFNMDQINAGKKITCTMEVEGDHKMLTDESQLLIYRIAQEAIHNVLSHADARNIKISLLYKPALFKMSIADDGIGFDMSKINEAETMGIGNMRKRSRALDGILEITSALGKGCNVALLVNMRYSPGVASEGSVIT